MKKFVGFIVLSILLGASTGWPAEGEGPQRRAIEVLDVSPGMPVVVALDGAVYSKSQIDWADLRVSGPDGREVPFALWTAPVVPLERRLNGTTIEKTFDATGSRLTMDLGSARRINRMTLKTSEKNFVRKADVSVSDDGTQWRDVLQGIVVYSLRRNGWDGYLRQFHREVYSGVGYSEVGGEDLSIDLPETSARFIKIVLPMGADQEPVELVDAELYEKVRSESPQDAYAGTITRTEAGGEGRTTEVTLDFQYAHLRLTHLEIETGRSNFSRPVEAMISENGSEWVSAGQATLSSINFAGLNRENRSIPLSGSPARYVKLIIRNGDNPPLPVLSVTAYAVRRYAVFLPAAPGRYYLRYGDPGATRVSYDTGALLGEVSLENLRLLPLSSEEPDLQRKATPAPVEKRENSILLWTALIGMMAGLLFLAYQMIRRTDAR